MNENIHSLVQKLSLEQKARLCTGASKWATVAYEELGISSLLMSDGPHGLRRMEDEHADVQHSLPATCFPTAALTACTWDRELLAEMGHAMAEEAIAQGVDIILGPGVNIKRSPLCGRNFEYFSEDPYLAGELASALIQSIQSKGVGTSLKHYAVNNQETQRLMLDAQLSERALREIYLPAFEKAVKEAKPYSVMCSYNKINGSYASENEHLLTEILKGEWGFEGFVVSDWGAVHNQVAALKGGLDLEMPGPDDADVQRVVEAVKTGRLDEARLDDAVRRILGVLSLARQTPKKGCFSIEKHHQLAAKLASEGIVLLKNDGILPLAAQKKVAVIGRTALEPLYQGNGSSRVNPTQLDAPLDALKAVAPEVCFSYSEGYPADEGLAPDLIENAIAAARASEAALLFIGLPSYIEAEGYDRSSLHLTKQQIALIKAVAKAQPKTILILNNGAPIAMAEWLGSVSAVVEAYTMGQAGAQAVAAVLFGKVNPSGKLAESFPLNLEDTPSYLNFPGEAHQVCYGEGLYVGYRYNDTMRKEVLFPFGYGLSYTQFTYKSAHVSVQNFNDKDGVDVLIEVENSGNRAGKEVVQVYVRPLNSRLPRPDKELKGFAKLSLEPGESKTAKIHLDFRAFAYWHPLYKQWVTDSGKYEIIVGASSRDIKACLPVELHSTLKLPCILNRESSIREWEEDPYGGPFFRELKAMLMDSIGESALKDATMGIDYERMMQNDPLENILRNLPGMHIPDPIGMVNMLLEQVHARAKADQTGR
ncbi:MAG: glycoside hydrolase family 3 C-terminal domain-containing protein [Anaerolineaceae bacterium]|nr:glycoside hydrolase family 3 C-terminal domain-containing protein [Anaerolineaceae bacterium]